MERDGIADGGSRIIFYLLRKAARWPSGLGDMLVGVKQTLGNVAGFGLAIVPALSAPSGSRSCSSGGVDSQIELPGQREISGPLSISGTLGIFDLTDNRRRRPVGQCQVEIEREIGKRLDGFAEFQGFDGVRTPNHSLQIGGGYKRRNQRIDYYIVIGLSRAAPNLAVGVGYSFRSDRLWQKIVNRHRPELTIRPAIIRPAVFPSSSCVLGRRTASTRTGMFLPGRQ